MTMMLVMLAVLTRDDVGNDNNDVADDDGDDHDVGNDNGDDENDGDNYWWDAFLLLHQIIFPHTMTNKNKHSSVITFVHILCFTFLFQYRYTTQINKFKKKKKNVLFILLFKPVWKGGGGRKRQRKEEY